eukprot:CAMPEP_0119396038 /NCGR_PEP_ID=MMETSP1334-20130426/135438_1 /TAXON_ID=127549 /ORGANISM="Calcidiscus leptoporus, Strain RCC1130" /LENGTH=219 /DNA_ID=CAMNT_0007419631 /DNA_START=361 /DNA_END=1018 /DNA_ORIENTATION=+
MDQDDLPAAYLCASTVRLAPPKRRLLALLRVCNLSAEGRSIRGALLIDGRDQPALADDLGVNELKVTEKVLPVGAFAADEQLLRGASAQVRHVGPAHALPLGDGQHRAVPVVPAEEGVQASWVGERAGLHLAQRVLLSAAFGGEAHADLAALARVEDERAHHVLHHVARAHAVGAQVLDPEDRQLGRILPLGGEAARSDAMSASSPICIEATQRRGAVK